MRKISYKTNCGFFSSCNDVRLAGNDKRVLDEKTRTFLDLNFERGIKVTLELLPKHESKKKIGDSK